MKPDQLVLEADLRDFRAATLDSAFLMRLEAAAEGNLTQLTAAETHFEQFLRQTPPTKLTPAFLASLEAIVHELPFDVNEKIVLFPKTAALQARAKIPVWAAAAAVAMVGALTALMMPVGKGPSNVVRHSAPSSPVTAGARGNLIPASFNRGVSEVHDEGVVWKSNNQPHSLVRVVYKDKITLKDTSGRTYQVEQPRVEYLLVPAKTD